MILASAAHAKKNLNRAFRNDLLHRIKLSISKILYFNPCVAF